MNNCVLMAEIIKDPELRYTQDGQTPISEMLVEFPALRAEDPVETLKVIGWGNLAQQIQEQFHVGDRVVLEGRLTMNTIDRPEGFKEKRAEFTAARVHLVSPDGTMTSTVAVTSETAPAKSAPVTPTSTPTPASAPADLPNYDDIPF
jgi:single-strand DNA-binding protein